MQLTFDEVLTEPPAEEGDDSVNDPDDLEHAKEEEAEDADDHGDPDDDDE